MAAGRITISVTGGSANFGNVSQGDRNANSVQSQRSRSEADPAFASFFAALEERRAEAPAAEFEDLKQQIDALKAAMKKRDDDVSFAATTRKLYERYGWAGDLLGKLFRFALPGWLP